MEIALRVKNYLITQTLYGKQTCSDNVLKEKKRVSDRDCIIILPSFGENSRSNTSQKVKQLGNATVFLHVCNQCTPEVNSFIHFYENLLPCKCEHDCEYHVCRISFYVNT